MIRIVIHGSSGRMGRELRAMVKDDPELEIVAGIDARPDEDTDFLQFSDIAECNVPADAAIDVSTHAAVPGFVDWCRKNKVPAVICTTALTPDCLAKIEDASKEIAIFRSANMSLGINLLAKAIRAITPALQEDFNVEIVEMHHNQKIDSPSGTAIMLADVVNESCQQKKDYLFGRHGKTDECKITDLGIHAIRGGTTPGEHIVIYAGTDEIIELKHIALSRKILAGGTLKAVRFAVQQPPGQYSMDDMLK